VGAGATKRQRATCPEVAVAVGAIVLGGVVVGVVGPVLDVAVAEDDDWLEPDLLPFPTRLATLNVLSLITTTNRPRSVVA
jgi:hypothetical protein